MSTLVGTADTLEDVELTDVIVDLNVRTDVHLDKSFVASIRNHGILQPPIGWRGDDGKVRITAGQRRTLAAIEIGAERIAVIIKPQEIAEAARIVTQLTENDQRQQLTDSERVYGYKQLAMFGVSADQIARKTNAPKAQVVTALKVASSEIAEDAIASYPINLEQAADLRSATTVRRAWIHDTLLADGRKIDIPNAMSLIATALLDVDTSASEGKYYAIAAELLDISYEAAPKGTYDPRATTAVKSALTAGGDPLRIALAVAIARTESVLGDPTGWPNARDSKTTVAYYKRLEAWGYTLSDVEAGIVNPPKKGRGK